MRTISIPSAVQRIYQAVQELEESYPGRKFTPDGHLVGSIGEVIAAQAFDLELLPMSHKGHDARDQDGRMVQIKLTGGKRVSMYGESERLIVMRFIDPTIAGLVYDGCGKAAWDAAGPVQKNGQRSISLARLQTLSG